jgi:hypothetical protein
MKSRAKAASRGKLTKPGTRPKHKGQGKTCGKVHNASHGKTRTSNGKRASHKKTAHAHAR